MGEEKDCTQNGTDSTPLTLKSLFGVTIPVRHSAVLFDLGVVA